MPEAAALLWLVVSLTIKEPFQRTRACVCCLGAFRWGTHSYAQALPLSLLLLQGPALEPHLLQLCL